MKNVIFHHNDADGFTAAAICIKHALSSVSNITKEEYDSLIKTQVYGYHGSLLDYIDIIDPDDHVYIVDLSFTADTVDQLRTIWDKLDNKNNLYWIDHHKSSIELMSSNPMSVPGIRDDRYCGAYLAYRYFYSGDRPEYTESKDEYYDMPTFIKYVDKYDCFKDVNKSVQEFMLGYQAKSEPLDYDGYTGWWAVMLDYNANLGDKIIVDSLIKTGSIIYDYRESKYKAIRKRIFYGHLKAPGFEDKIIPFVNTDESSSLVFGDIYDNYPAVCVFRTDGNNWFASLYSNIKKYPDTDCSIAAELLGGGGHKGAAGFSISNGKSIFDYIEIVDIESN